MSYVGIPYEENINFFLKTIGLKKRKTVSALLPSCLRAGDTTEIEFLLHLNADEKLKASKHSEVFDLVLPTFLMLAFTSCANCYFSRSMPKSKFLNSVCLLVNRVNKTG